MINVQRGRVQAEVLGHIYVSGERSDHMYQVNEMQGERSWQAIFCLFGLLYLSSLAIERTTYLAEI